MRIIMLKKLSTAKEEEENHTRWKNKKYLWKLRMERTKHTNDKKEEIDKLKNAIADLKA